MTRRRTAIPLMILLLGCGPKLEPVFEGSDTASEPAGDTGTGAEWTELPPITWEGDRVRFGTTQPNPPVGNTLQILDDTIKALELELDAPLPEGTKITYYHLFNNTALGGCDGVSCAIGTTVYANRLLEVHELVHAIMNASLGSSHRTLSEGLAEHLADRYYFEAGTGSHDPQEIIDALEDSLVSHVTSDCIDYETAGYFVTFLVDTFGYPLFKELYVRADRGSTRGDLDGMFMEIYGESLDEVLTRMGAQLPDCHVENLCRFSSFVSWDPSSPTLETSFHVHGDSADIYEIGVYTGSRDAVVLSRQMELPWDGNYGVYLRHSGDLDIFGPILNKCHEPAFTIVEHYTEIFHALLTSAPQGETGTIYAGTVFMKSGVWEMEILSYHDDLAALDEVDVTVDVTMVFQGD